VGSIAGHHILAVEGFQSLAEGEEGSTAERYILPLRSHRTSYAE